MSDKTPHLKSLIRSYILEIGGLLKEELNQPQFEFGFRFLYPNERGRIMLIARPKGKSVIEISQGTPLSPEHRQGFTALPERDKKNFVKNLQKILFRSEVDYSYEFTKHYTIVLIDKLFLEGDAISINDLFRAVRRIYSSTMNIIFFIQDFFSEEFDPASFTIG